MKKTILASLLAAASLAPLAAFASDGTIQFNGEVTATTCTVNINGGGANPKITLPKVSSATLNAANKVAGATNFNVSLTACTPATGGARVFFEAGTGVDAVSGRLINGTGTATNVQVQLLNSAGGVIVAGAPSGSQNTGAMVPITGGAATLSYAAQYFATAAATVGTVVSNVTYSIEYQ